MSIKTIDSINKLSYPPETGKLPLDRNVKTTVTVAGKDSTVQWINRHDQLGSTNFDCIIVKGPNTYRDSRKFRHKDIAPENINAAFLSTIANQIVLDLDSQGK